MFLGGKRPLALIVALAIAAAMALATGCGDDDNDGGGVDGTADASQAADKRAKQPGEAEGLTGDAAEIQTTYETFAAAIFAKDADTACAALSAQARKRFSGDSTCEVAMKNLSASEGLSRQRPYLAKVTVRSNGQRAVAKAKVKDSRAYPVPFVQEQGEWKIDGGF
jgi:hypothetical protein